MAKEEKNKVKGFKNLKQELKKVVWPTPKQLINNTVAVITIVLITAVIVFALDFTFKKVNEFDIEKLKSNVQPKDQQIQVQEESQEEQKAEPTDNNIETVENTENSTEQEQNVQEDNQVEQNEQNSVVE